MTTTQRTAVDQTADAIRRNGFVAVITEHQDGTIKVQREGATSYAIVGRRGGIRWH